jgi:hypothetical protein
MHPTTIPDAPTRSLQNIEDKQADEPAKKGVTPCGIYVLPLLHRRGWKHLIFKIYMYEYMQDVLCQVMEHNMQLKC